MRVGLIIVAIAMIVAPSLATTLVVQLPADQTVQVATAIERGSSISKVGKADGASARFSDLLPGSVYDLSIEEKSGTLLCGVDMSWCDDTPADPQAEALGDDDREAIRAIVQDIKSFANKSKILRLEGTHDRAVALLDLTRDNGFHSDKGDEVIWRVEVWFFQWENGGWERVPNQSRLLRRERFASHADLTKEFERIRWIPSLGGVKIPKSGNAPTITVNMSITASTREKN